MRLPMVSQLHSWQIGESYQGYPSGHRQGCLIESPGADLGRFLHLVHQGLAKVLTGLRARTLLELWPELPMHQSIVEYIMRKPMILQAKAWSIAGEN